MDSGYVTFSDKKGIFYIRINLDVLSKLHSFRQIEGFMPESGGVLIGEVYGNNGFWIKDVTSPFKNDISDRYRFVRQDPAHQKVVQNWHQKSNGTMQYLGEWHSHPEKKPSPSLIDLCSWKKLSLNMKSQMGGQPFLLIILSMIDLKKDWVAIYDGKNNYTKLEVDLI
ncbi:Mov34/MPN/PAD-1 family protein [Acinetobacter sp. ANC 4177]|uniref:Mov34/MPN/PAD-1 family protein n=1 Tax=Acinetobacter sp. ANC 4177 TaxID=2529838 RepID=UPI0010389591|nr:Mov34/MPN/PAD-1 family protein [Acinetobacter sp. ANC 4177]TCB75662.1 hypothetical protein E0H91_04505 [Acinetobacter sp. ANC 4177]